MTLTLHHVCAFACRFIGTNMHRDGVLKLGFRSMMQLHGKGIFKDFLG